METIVINTKDKSSAKFILDLITRLGEKGRILDTEQKEDFALGMLMKKEKTGKEVSRATINKKLKG